MNVLLWIWQLPQNLLGLIVILFTRAKKNYAIYDGIVYDYWLTERYKFGVSLGNYVIIGGRSYTQEDTIKHEHGHQIQSKRLGWLYLLTVGIISGTRNRIDVFFHKKWTYFQRVKWYYSTWPENEADKLGKVKRF